MRFAKTVATAVALSCCLGRSIAAQVASPPPDTSFGKWRVVAFANDLTGAREQRIVLRSEEWRAVPSSPSSEIYFGSTLILACGDRMVGDSGRTLILFPGQAFALYGTPPQAVAEIRFAGSTKYIRLQAYAYEYRDLVVFENEIVAKEWVATLSDDPGSLFSAELFRRLIRSDSVTIRYNATNARVTSAFDLRGLRTAIGALKGCRWPDGAD